MRHGLTFAALALTLTACGRSSPPTAPPVRESHTVICCDSPRRVACTGPGETCCASHGGRCDGWDMTFDEDQWTTLPPVASATHPLGTDSIAPPSGAPNAPEVPSRARIGEAIASIRPALVRCAAGSDVHAQVTIVFASSGHATRGAVSGSLADDSLESCVLTALRDASVPPFARPTFTVAFPVVAVAETAVATR